VTTSLAPEQLDRLAGLRDRLAGNPPDPSPVTVERRTCGMGHPPSEQRPYGCRACAREAKRRRRVRAAAATYGLIVLGAPRHVADKAATLGIGCIENLVESSLRAGNIDGDLVPLRGFGRLVAEVRRCRSPLTQRPAWRIIDMRRRQP